MNLGEAVVEFLKWLLDLRPLRIVHEGEQGCRSFKGVYEREPLGPGIHWHWPLLGEFHVEEVKTAVFRTAEQTLETRDGVPMTVSFGVRYAIRSLPLVMLRMRSDEDDDTLEESVCTAAASVVPSLDYHEIAAELPRYMLEQTRQRVAGWGYKIHDVQSVDCVRTQTVRLLGVS